MEEVKNPAKNTTRYGILLVTIGMILLIWLSTYLPVATISDLELSDKCNAESTLDNYNNKSSIKEEPNNIKRTGIYCRTKMRMKYLFPTLYYFIRWMNLD